MERLEGITTERLTDLAGRLFFDTAPPCRPSARSSSSRRCPTSASALSSPGIKTKKAAG